MQGPNQGELGQVQPVTSRYGGFDEEVCPSLMIH